MPKAKLTTRERTTSNVSTDTLAKGTQLTHAEADSNFINLRDQSFGIADDSSTVLQVSADKTITVAGGTGITTALSGDTLTITGTPNHQGITFFGDDSAGINISDGGGIHIRGGDNVTTSTNSDGTLTISSLFANTGDLTIDTYTSSDFGVGTVRFTVPGGHDLELNAGTGGGPGGSGDRLIQFRDRVQFHGALGTDGSNANLHFAPNGNGLIQHYTAQTGYTFPKLTGNEAGKFLVMGGIDGSSVNTLSFSSIGETFDGLTLSDNKITSANSNDDLELDASGTGVINAQTTVRFDTNYKEDIQALSSASTIAVDCSLAPVFTVTLAHGATFNFSNLATGQSVSLIIRQDGSGSRTGAFTSVLFPGNQHTLSTGANDIDIVSIFNDGTSLLGNISKDYS